jgi:hypothetical protein
MADSASGDAFSQNGKNIASSKLEGWKKLSDHPSIYILDFKTPNDGHELHIIDWDRALLITALVFRQQPTW